MAILRVRSHHRMATAAVSAWVVVASRRATTFHVPCCRGALRPAVPYGQPPSARAFGRRSRDVRPQKGRRKAAIKSGSAGEVVNGEKVENVDLPFGTTYHVPVLCKEVRLAALPSRLPPR